MSIAEATTPVLSVLRRFGGPHRHWLYKGLVATLGWVACRLAMPWPLKGVIEAAFPGHAHKADPLSQLAPASWDPVLVLCGAYVVLAVCLGVCERIHRGSMSRFTGRTVDDLREAALRGAAKRGLSQERGGHGDLIARLVGDVARLREELKGIFVHAAQSALLFVAICALLLVLSPRMGLFFLVGGLLATVIGFRASAPVAKHARRQRAAEGHYAATLEVALAHGNLDLVTQDTSDPEDEEESFDVGMLADSNLLIHVLLAATVGAALLAGIYQVRAGDLSPGALFLFVAYALTVNRRLVQLGRQLARSGKVRASIDRISFLLTDEGEEAAGVSVPPLSSALELSHVRLASARGHGDRARLRRLDLSIRAGTHIAVLGRPGAGKSTLLRCIAGLEQGAEGLIRWDGMPLSAASRTGVAYLPQDPVFPPQKVRQLLGLGDDEELGDDRLGVLKRIGAWRPIKRLPRGLDDKVGSTTVSKNEARALDLGSILLGGDSLWVLDAPLEGLARKLARRRLEEILARAAGRTLVVALPKLYDADRFDRVLVVKRGKVKFDGTPAQWAAWRAGGEREELQCAG